MNRLWKHYNLGIVLLVLFVAAWAIQTYTGWEEFEGNQQQDGKTAQVFGEGGFVYTWASATFENWQSEFLQLLSFVFFTSFLIFRGSPESRDGDDEMQAKLDEILRELDHLKRQMNGGTKSPT